MLFGPSFSIPAFFTYLSFVGPSFFGFAFSDDPVERTVLNQIWGQRKTLDQTYSGG